MDIYSISYIADDCIQHRNGFTSLANIREYLNIAAPEIPMPSDKTINAKIASIGWYENIKTDLFIGCEDRTSFLGINL